MQTLFDFEANQKDLGPNFYEILGCTQQSSTEQINTEFKVRALQYHPDKNNNDENSEKQFKLLLEAKEALTDPVVREKYDMWLNSGVYMPWKNWINFTTKNQTVMR